MKPKSPFIQAFNELPGQLPIYTLENALLPGGELPLELSEPSELALFFNALKSDQLIGLVQPAHSNSQTSTHKTGCAGRIRQYRERKGGKLNVMLTGVCRYKIIEKIQLEDGYTKASVDWADFEGDYQDEDVDPGIISDFKSTLRNYFDRHNMKVDWKVLEDRPIEEVANNLVLVMNLDIDSKQQLLESITVTQRLELFTRLLDEKADPILATTPATRLVN